MKTIKTETELKEILTTLETTSDLQFQIENDVVTFSKNIYNEICLEIDMDSNDCILDSFDFIQEAYEALRETYFGY